MNVSPSRKGCVRACERCRKSKVRCLVDTVDRDGKCKRCCKAGAECVFPLLTGSQQRRRRTDARIASIEEKLAAVNAAITKDQAPQLLTPSSAFGVSDDIEGNTIPSGPLKEAAALSLATSDAPTKLLAKRLLDNQPTSSVAVRRPLDGEDVIPGYVDQSLLSIDQAKVLLSDFKGKMIQEYPIVALSENDSFDTLRTEKPILLFAIISSASQGRCPTLFRRLHRELQTVLAEKAILEGRKSLELIQAILLMEAWYCPPDDLDRLNFCQWANVAGSMALQLGLIGVGRPMAPGAGEIKDFNDVTESELAGWRAIVVVSLTVSTVAISLHQQAIFGLKYASQRVFEALSAGSTLARDQRLIAWARLQLVAEDIETLRVSTSLDTNPRTPRLDLERLEAQLDAWRQSLALDVMNTSLNVHFLYCRCKLFELAMLAELRRGQLPVPDGQRYEERVSMQEIDTSITPSLVKAVMSVIQCCHGIIDLVCQMDIQLYLDCPTVTTVRALYAINTLSALQRSFVEHNTIMSKFIDQSSIMLDRYSNRLRAFLYEATGPQEHVVPRMVLSTLDQAARQPYLLQEHNQTFRTDQVTDSEPVDGAHANPHNDLEAVVVSTMPDAARAEQGSVVSSHNSPDNTLPQTHTYSAPISQKFAPATALNLPPPESTATGVHRLSEFDLMCMPDLMNGANSWPLAGNNEMNPFMPGLEFGLPPSAYLSSAWL